MVPGINLPGAVLPKNFTINAVTNIRQHRSEYLHAAPTRHRTGLKQVLFS
jgi:hypothetical protein